MKRVWWLIIVFCIGLGIGRFWQAENNRIFAEMHHSAMSINRFMELNPYFSNKGTGMQVPMNMPGPMFDTRVLSYRLFIRPFAKNEDGTISPSKDNRHIPEDWVDVYREENTGFEDDTPIRNLRWTGKSLIITKEFSEWELENPNNPSEWILRLIRKGN